MRGQNGARLDFESVNCLCESFFFLLEEEYSIFFFPKILKQLSVIHYIFHIFFRTCGRTIFYGLLCRFNAVEIFFKNVFIYFYGDILEFVKIPSKAVLGCFFFFNSELPLDTQQLQFKTD